MVVIVVVIVVFVCRLVKTMSILEWRWWVFAIHPITEDGKSIAVMSVFVFAGLVDVFVVLSWTFQLTLTYIENSRHVLRHTAKCRAGKMSKGPSHYTLGSLLSCHVECCDRSSIFVFLALLTWNGIVWCWCLFVIVFFFFFFLLIEYEGHQ